MLMKNRSSTRFALLATALILGTPAQPLNAAVAFYDNLASFQAASVTTVAVSFEGFSPTNVGIPPTLTLGGVTFTSLEPVNGPNFVVAEAGYPLFDTPPISTVLTVSGNENIDMDLSTTPTAVGFDTYTNQYDPAVVSVYDTQGNLIATHTLAQAPGTLGFMGITSDVPIGKVNWRADRGGLRNTAIDNVRVGAVFPHNLKFYLHGYDVPGTAGGFTMNEDPAPDHILGVSLLNAPCWFSVPTVTGTFQPGATFKVRIKQSLGLNIATTFRLAATSPDGSGEQPLGQVTQTLGLALGPQTVTIPVAVPLTLSNQRLKLTISSVAGVNVNLQLGRSSYLEATGFVGTP